MVVVGGHPERHGTIGQGLGLELDLEQTEQLRVRGAERNSEASIAHPPVRAALRPRLDPDSLDGVGRRGGEAAQEPLQIDGEELDAFRTSDPKAERGVLVRPSVGTADLRVHALGLEDEEEGPVRTRGSDEVDGGAARGDRGDGP